MNHVLLFFVSLLLFTSGLTSSFAQEATPWAKRFSYGDKVQVKKDLVYTRPEPGRSLKLDLYFPGKASKKPRPAILCFHGGGWEGGHRQLHHAHAEYFAGQGFVAATVSYRLRPEVNIDGCVHDAKAAVRWLRANAKAYGVDPERIGAFGASAEAHLSVMLTVTANDPALEGTGGNPKVSSRVTAAVGLATPANLEISLIRKRYQLSPALAKTLSPNKCFSKGDSPLLLLHCPKDPLVPYFSSVLLVRAAEAVGVRAKLEPVETGGHTFWFKEAGFNQTMPSATAFFRKELAAGVQKPR